MLSTVRTRFGLAAAVLAASVTARAQQVGIVTAVRGNSPRVYESVSGTVDTSLPVGLRDCPCESWTITGTFAGSTTGANPRFEWWVGQNAMACATVANRWGSGTLTPSCWQIPTDIVPIQAIAPNFTVVIPSVLLINPVSRRCTPLAGLGNSGSMFLTIMARGPDEQPPSVTREIGYNFDRPAAPSSITATAQESAVRVQWSIGATGADDAGVAIVSPSIVGFWVLCLPGPPTTFDAGSHDGCPNGPVYVGEAGLLPADAGLDVTSDLVSVTDTGTGTDALTMDVAPTGDAPAAACSQLALPADFDPNDDAQFRRYVCSDLRSRTEDNFTVHGLQNNTPYRFAVVTQDNAGNRSTPTVTATCVTPVPVTDFWEHYRNSGGRAQPGLCSARVGSTAHSSAGVVVAAAVAALVVAGRRARRKVRESQ